MRCQILNFEFLFASKEIYSVFSFDVVRESQVISTFRDAREFYRRNKHLYLPRAVEFVLASFLLFHQKTFRHFILFIVIVYNWLLNTLFLSDLFRFNIFIRVQYLVLKSSYFEINSWTWPLLVLRKESSSIEAFYDLYGVFLW